MSANSELLLSAAVPLRRILRQCLPIRSCSKIVSDPGRLVVLLKCYRETPLIIRQVPRDRGPFHHPLRYLDDHLPNGTSRLAVTHLQSCVLTKPPYLFVRRRFNTVVRRSTITLSRCTTTPLLLLPRSAPCKWIVISHLLGCNYTHQLELRSALTRSAPLVQETLKMLVEEVPLQVSSAHRIRG